MISMLRSARICPEFENETELDGDYPVYGGYLYVFSSDCGTYQNAVYESPFYGSGYTARRIIADIERELKVTVSAFKRCNIPARQKALA
jgi:hypothetical protein